jgi:hypothetical protein
MDHVSVTKLTVKNVVLAIKLYSEAAGVDTAYPVSVFSAPCRGAAAVRSTAATVKSG